MIGQAFQYTSGQKVRILYRAHNADVVIVWRPKPGFQSQSEVCSQRPHSVAILSNVCALRNKNVKQRLGVLIVLYEG
ncbi:hypothetical protein BKK80_19245 [Cupriavidus malaysiensis]|uniref:Uncharacterized protein n=1 Tax=Cupriavidus malaysiensis TaxID=367825 RepID=A0ABN4TQZ5_9BURK|nr:hypothetical protein BKK80_19245 [Cupriavidus malaysiensis]